MNAVRVLLALALACASVTAIAQTPARVALVVGNAAYADAPLRNPVNDARAMAESLRALGFTVTVIENQKLAEMRAALRAFTLSARTASVRLFYFAGHGLQLRGRSYLLPIGAKIKSESDILGATADASELVEQLSAIEVGANIVIIDACRTHPVFALASRRMWAAKPGMAEMVPPTGTVVAFSTRPGQVARDGTGPLSIYTRHLTVELREAPALPVEALFKRVRAAVAAETKNAQVPWESSDLNGELCFRPAPNGQCARTE
jgi:uncharacterized caspase-like protein